MQGGKAELVSFLLLTKSAHRPPLLFIYISGSSEDIDIVDADASGATGGVLGSSSGTFVLGVLATAGVFFAA